VRHAEVTVRRARNIASSAMSISFATTAQNWPIRAEYTVPVELRPCGYTGIRTRDGI
jgi:hypothetical protein